MALRLCLVGYGSIARAHMEALKREDVLLQRIVGRLPEPTAAFSAEFGFAEHTTSFNAALLADDFDAVLITSPTDLHEDQTERALRAGKHVLCEIPLATNLAAVDRLGALADQMGVRLMVCHTQRFQPAIVEARRRIASGALHPHHIVVRFMFFRRENVNWVGRRRSWTDNLLWHHGCHAVDTTLFILGADEATVSGQIALPGEHLGIPMDLGLVLRTPLDQLVTIAMSYNTHLPLHDYLIIGEEDTLLVSDWRLRNRDGVIGKAPGDSAVPLGPIVAQDREFLAAVREGREPAVSARAIRPAMAALQAAQEQFEAFERSAISRHQGTP